MTYDIYAAFGNKVRVKLLLCLSQKAKSVSELVSTCGLAQSAVSQHLAKLRESGLVSIQKEGKQVYYSLRFSHIKNICEQLLILEEETV